MGYIWHPVDRNSDGSFAFCEWFSKMLIIMSKKTCFGRQHIEYALANDVTEIIASLVQIHSAWLVWSYQVPKYWLATDARPFMSE